MRVIDEPDPGQPFAAGQAAVVFDEGIDAFADLRAEEELDRRDRQEREGQSQEDGAGSGRQVDAEPRSEGLEGHVEQGAQQDDRQGHVERDDPGLQAGPDHLPAQPSLEPDQHETQSGAVANRRLCAAVSKRTQEGGEYEDPDRHAHEPVGVFDPHFDGIELGDIVALLQEVIPVQVLDARRRQPGTPAPGPVGTAQAGPGDPHQAADGDKQDRGRQRRQGRLLKGVHDRPS